MIFGFMILMIVVTVINLFGQKFVKFVMNMATAGKLAALILIIVAGGVFFFKNRNKKNIVSVC